MWTFKEEQDNIVLELVQGTIVMVLVAAAVLVDVFLDGEPPHKTW